MDNMKRLELNYGTRANVGKKSVEELIEFLKSKGKVTEMNLDEISPTIIKYFVVNIKNIDNERNRPTKNADCKLIAYKFEKCEENESFYESYTLPQDELEKGEVIYVIFEVIRGSIESNCTKLSLDLCVYQGIDESDVKNKTIAFYEHLFYIESIEKQWY